MNARCQKPFRTVKNRDGFTLIEMLIVIIILGILAMVIIPQITVSTDDAKVSAAKANLATLRSAIGLYHVQHSNKYPDANIVNQLTLFTNVDGGNSGNYGATTYNLGPYLKGGFPTNPFVTNTTNAALVNVCSTADLTAPRAMANSGAEGWQYWNAVGIIFLNDSDTANGHKSY